ncbi:MAG: hypothetical protein E6G71_04065 [Alphaproteobacteria bacterium]|nr:MAG: hypothetical protein E6G71_04065 [Alphaproteobacteria bacterium]
MSFRGARSANPESITTIRSMDSGLAPSGAPRNDAWLEGAIKPLSLFAQATQMSCLRPRGA